MRRTPQEPLFNSLLEQYHYLRYQQPVGEHLKYSGVRQRASDCVPGVVFGAAALGESRSLYWLERGGSQTQSAFVGI